MFICWLEILLACFEECFLSSRGWVLSHGYSRAHSVPLPVPPPSLLNNSILSINSNSQVMATWALTLAICCSKPSLHQATPTERWLRWKAWSSSFLKRDQGMKGKGIREASNERKYLWYFGGFIPVWFDICTLLPLPKLFNFIRLLQQIVFTLENLGGNSLMAVTHPAEAPYGRKVWSKLRMCCWRGGKPVAGDD